MTSRILNWSSNNNDDVEAAHIFDWFEQTSFIKWTNFEYRLPDHICVSYTSCTEICS